MSQDNTFIKLDEDLTNQMTINKNLSQEIIVTNTDKVTILLNDHHKIIKKKKEWITPLGLFITVLTTLLTAKFDTKVFGISAEMWHSIFILTCIFTFIYTLYLSILSIKYIKRGTINDFISRLKNQESGQGQISISFFKKLLNKPIIHSAKYGANGKYIDVTDIISNSISNKKNEILVSNDLAGDPNPGVVKSLEIIYSKGWKNPKNISEKEGSKIKIS